MDTTSRLQKMPRRHYWELLIPLLFFALVFLFYPFRDAFWMDNDEGINLIKAQMLLRGYPLYSAIWSDQPPLFTYLLAFVFDIFGMQVNYARTLVLLLSAGLVWAYFHVIKTVWGNLHAAAGLILLLLLPRFIDLSTSVMIGLPSIAFAALSLLALIGWHTRRRHFWLLLSALLLAVSVSIKLFTGFLAPIFACGVLFSEVWVQRTRRKGWQAAKPALLWGMVFSVLVIVPLVTLVGFDHFDQLLGNHAAASALEKYHRDPSYRLAAQLVESRPFLLLAVIGLVEGLRSKRWLTLYPSAWMITAYGLLAGHVPVWGHQQLLITIPAGMLAAAAVGEGLTSLIQVAQRRSRFSLRMILTLASLTVFTYIGAARAPGILSAFNASPEFHNLPYKENTTEAKFMKKVLKYAPKTHWMVTDLPIYAFYAGLPVPPELVVFSSKRVETGNLSEGEVLAAVQTLAPEQVLIGRNDFPELREHLKTHYNLILQKDEQELYLINELVRTGAAP